MSTTPYGLFLDMQMVQYPMWSERGSNRYPREHAQALAAKPGLIRAAGMNPLLPLPRDLPAELWPLLRWGTAQNFRTAAAQGPLAYFLMSPFTPVPSSHLLPQFIMNPAVPLITTLVDVTPLAGIDPSFDDPVVNRRYRSRFDVAKQADLVLAISENTRRDAIRLVDVDPSRIVNVGAGYSPLLAPPIDPEVPARILHAELPAITRPFVFSVTGHWKWKNTPALIDAFARLPRDVRSGLQLVVTCRLDDEFRRQWTDRALSAGLTEDDFVFTGLVTEPVLKALYQSAALFVYPSVYEGFGLPALEAAACGCPVITSETSSMPEILNMPASQFDPHNADDMSGLIHRAFTDPAFRVELTMAAARAARTHTWEAVANRTVEAMKVLPEPVEGARGPVTANLRLAVVGQFKPGPARSALGELSKICDVDLWTTGSADRPSLREATGLPCRPASLMGLKMSPASYDWILYLLDGTPDDEEVVAVSRMYPGILWFQGAPPLALFPSFGSDRPEPITVGRNALGIVVGSPVQRRMIVLDKGPGSPLPPIKVIAHQAEENGQPERSAHRVVEELVQYLRRLPALTRFS